MQKLLALILAIFSPISVLSLSYPVDNAGNPLPNSIETFYIDARTMWLNRDLTKSGRKDLNPALNKLYRIADAAVSDPVIYTVTAKPTDKLAPSGDPHDFYSLARYYWPGNSTNPLPYVRYDGYPNPEIFNIPDSDYLKTIIDDTFYLGLAYFWSGNESYAQFSVRKLNTWFIDPVTKMNPNLNFANWIKGYDALNSNSTTPLGTGLLDLAQVYKLIDGIQLIRKSPAYTADIHNALQTWFQQYSQWLTTSARGIFEGQSPNNQGTWYDVQVAAIYLFINQRDAAAATQRTTISRVNTQILPDGTQPFELARTLSWTYSNFNLLAMFAQGWLCQTTQVPLFTYTSPDGRSIPKALNYLMGFAVNNGTGWRNSSETNLDYDEIISLSKQAYVEYKDVKYIDFVNKMQTEPQIWNINKLWSPYGSFDAAPSSQSGSVGSRGMSGLGLLSYGWCIILLVTLM
ncbi:hypothetical protein HK098_003148 [Nowakowskiella sp. JEL0407]|nr:hypothetical protein HK098_003148 [Nowakowskiella sp. JEL0407]